MNLPSHQLIYSTHFRLGVSAILFFSRKSAAGAPNVASSRKAGALNFSVQRAHLCFWPQNELTMLVICLVIPRFSCFRLLGKIPNDSWVFLVSWKAPFRAHGNSFLLLCFWRKNKSET